MSWFVNPMKGIQLADLKNCKICIHSNMVDKLAKSVLQNEQLINKNTIFIAHGKDTQ